MVLSHLAFLAKNLKFKKNIINRLKNRKTVKYARCDRTGVSGQKLNKNGSSPRANSQLQSGDTPTVLESGIPGRATVLQKEGQVVEGLRKAGERLPDNQRPKIH